MKHLKKHFRTHGRYKFNHNSHWPSQREDDLEKRHPFNSKRAPFHQNSDILDLAALKSSNNLIKGFPDLSIFSNNDVIYDTSSKSNENSKTFDDFSDDYNDHNYNHLDKHHHRNRHPRSVSAKMKGPLLTSSFRKLSSPGREPVAEENLTKEEPTESDESPFEDILSTTSNTSGTISSSSSGPSASISEAIPTNSGVTKIEINLSFGCLFFCE